MGADMRVGLKKLSLAVVRFEPKLEYADNFLAKLTNIKFHENPLSECGVISRGHISTHDEVKRIIYVLFPRSLRKVT
jgi:hypothetical protein